MRSGERSSSSSKGDVSVVTGVLLDGLTDEQLDVLAARLAPRLRAERELAGRLLSPAEAAARLGIHPKTLTRAAREGRVPGARRVGRGWRFDPSLLDLLPVARPSVRPSPPRREVRHTRSSSAAVEAIRTGGANTRR
jgi:excisionase family DNA binding protein